MLGFDTSALSNKYNLIYTLCLILTFIQQAFIKLLIMSKHRSGYVVSKDEKFLIV